MCNYINLLTVIVMLTSCAAAQVPEDVRRNAGIPGTSPNATVASPQHNDNTEIEVVQTDDEPVSKAGKVNLDIIRADFLAMAEENAKYQTHFMDKLSDLLENVDERFSLSPVPLHSPDVVIESSPESEGSANTDPVGNDETTETAGTDITPKRNDEVMPVDLDFEDVSTKYFVDDSHLAEIIWEAKQVLNLIDETKNNLDKMHLRAVEDSMDRIKNSAEMLKNSIKEH